MSTLTDAIRDHHRSLLRSLEALAGRVTHRADPASAEGLAFFLNEELLPHARGEELHLYPALNPILREHAEPTATMSLDHQWIEAGIRRINDIARALPLAPDADRRALQEQLSTLALQMLAVVTLHVGKEEEAYLPVMDRHMADHAQRDILERMHASAEESPSSAAQKDHGECRCTCGGRE